MTDYSGFFTVEFYGPKGWEVEGCFTSLKDALDLMDRVFPGDYQMRITTPQINRNELADKVQKIREDHSQGLTTPEEFSKRVERAVLDSL